MELFATNAPWRRSMYDFNLSLGKSIYLSEALFWNFPELLIFKALQRAMPVRFFDDFFSHMATSFGGQRI
jgi:hypothetical protein